MNSDTIAQAYIAKELYSVDPGKSNGGVARWIDGKVNTFPLSKLTSYESIVDFFKSLVEGASLPLLVIEQITTFQGDIPGSNITPQERSRIIGRMYQMNKLKDHYVELISAIKLAHIPFIPVMPIHWQKYISVHIPGEDYEIRKHRLRDIAKDIYPGHKIVGWNADALLMIEFLRRKLKYDQRWILQKTYKPQAQSKITFA